jgi:hypothetical protein
VTENLRENGLFEFNSNRGFQPKLVTKLIHKVLNKCSGLFVNSSPNNIPIMLISSANTREPDVTTIHKFARNGIPKVRQETSTIDGLPKKHKPRKPPQTANYCKPLQTIANDVTRLFCPFNMSVCVLLGSGLRPVSESGIIVEVCGMVCGVFRGLCFLGRPSMEAISSTRAYFSSPKAGKKSTAVALMGVNVKLAEIKSASPLRRLAIIPCQTGSPVKEEVMIVC